MPTGLHFDRACDAALAGVLQQHRCNIHHGHLCTKAIFRWQGKKLQTQGAQILQNDAHFDAFR